MGTATQEKLHCDNTLTNHTKRNHSYLARDHGIDREGKRTRIVWLDHRLRSARANWRATKTGHPSASWKPVC